MAKVMEIFIYQNFRGKFYPKLKEKLKKLQKGSKKAPFGALKTCKILFSKGLILFLCC